MRLIDADAIEYTHAIARCIDDGHNWNELCVTKDEIDDMPTIEPDWDAIWDSLSKVYNMKDVPDEAKSIIGDLMLSLDVGEGKQNG